MTRGAHVRRVTWKRMTRDVLPLHPAIAEGIQVSTHAAGGVDDLHGLATVPRSMHEHGGLLACGVLPATVCDTIGDLLPSSIR
jgi:hypothetical protein